MTEKIVDAEATVSVAPGVQFSKTALERGLASNEQLVQLAADKSKELVRSNVESARSVPAIRRTLPM